VRAKALKDWQTGIVGDAARRSRVIGIAAIGSTAIENTDSKVGYWRGRAKR
jgi:hypothetical protein